ncbi:MAG: protein translocase subunit SecD [Anaerolineaceae bacterium]|nr:protein translocase subunit SecD [Anaerolineaceae bacterium]MBN2678557.1 protein translocase subunit SecD [Anaerolineaceae bacterium]
MTRKITTNLVIILIVVAVVIWLNLPSSTIDIGNFQRDLEPKLGLDLRGGLQVVLEVDLPAESEVTAQSMDDAKTIFENRANGLGVSEVVFQVAGTRRIVGEFPGLTDTEEVISVLRQVGQLAFVPMGTTPLAEGTEVIVDLTQVTATTTTTPEATLEPTVTPTLDITPEATADDSTTTETETPILTAIMTGNDLTNVGVIQDQIGNYQIAFELSDAGKKIFSDFTSTHIGEILGIVLDNKVISTPQIQSAITEGSGVIQGSFTLDSANALAIQLRYGSLPVPFVVAESRVVGPTLGSESLEKSLIAGLIGLCIVMLFMGLYYRVPGLVANLAILIFAGITLSVYKLIPVTLTLPGIAGFLLSTGSALDANILIFERLKEELRNGRSVKQAVALGFQRAWPSIRDSNIATFITSLILFWFGSQFGATIVKGFAVTLFLGIAISLFTALMVTRTLLVIIFDHVKPTKLSRWFGI